MDKDGRVTKRCDGAGAGAVGSQWRAITYEVDDMGRRNGSSDGGAGRER